MTSSAKVSEETSIVRAVVTMAISRASTVADARIEPRIHQVDDEIAYDEHGDGQHHQCLSQRVVLVLHGLHEQPADTIEVEYLLRDDQTADQECELDADQGHDGQQCILQCVAIDNKLVEQPLGALMLGVAGEARVVNLGYQGLGLQPLGQCPRVRAGPLDAQRQRFGAGGGEKACEDKEFRVRRPLA